VDAEEFRALPPSLLRSFGGLTLLPAEDLAKAGRAPYILHPLRCLCDLCVQSCSGDMSYTE